MQIDPAITIAHPELTYPKVSLVEASKHVFLQLAVEIDSHISPFWWGMSRKKRTVLQASKAYCNTITQLNGVQEATVFKGLLQPPGRGKLLEERQIPTAQYDVVILLEFGDQASLTHCLETTAYQELWALLQANSRKTHQMQASNVRRIGAVNHKKNGVFLFNYFYADELSKNLKIWEYTAGWFEQETNLDNSTLFLPNASYTGTYSIVNHCRWDSLWNILPSLIFKSSFRQYVLDNFYANQVAAMPILYQLA